MHAWLWDGASLGRVRGTGDSCVIWAGPVHSQVFQNSYTEILNPSVMAQMVKNRPAVEETWVQSLGRKDPLEKEMATHSNILAWGIPWIEEPSGLESMGCRESDTTD